MADDTYRFVIAESVAQWVHDQNPTKPCFEDFCSSLTWLGFITARKALASIRRNAVVRDESTVLYTGITGMRQPETYIYSTESLESLIALAEDGVR